MPRTRTTVETLYQFDELSERAQQKALQAHWNINVEEEWWDDVTRDINAFGEVSGLGCEYGNEFDCDRSSYVHIMGCCVLFSELLANREAMTGFPNLYDKVIQPFFSTFTEREQRQLLRLERADLLGSLTGETSTQRYGKQWDIERWDGQRTPHITKLLDKLQDAWGELLDNLEHAYLKMLRDEYEYLTDEEQIKESIRLNEDEFTEDGSRA
jgi:hypothetical protein